MIFQVGCLTCNKHIAVVRGCCVGCVAKHRKAIAKGKTTWAALEVQGLALAAKPKNIGRVVFKSLVKRAKDTVAE